MLHPTIEELTQGKFNRYELALATAKCARALTNEYIEQKEAAEKAATGNKDADRSVINAINKEYREEKAVKNAITKIHNGTYKIVRVDPTEEVAQETAAEEATEETTDAE